MKEKNPSFTIQSKPKECERNLIINENKEEEKTKKSENAIRIQFHRHFRTEPAHMQTHHSCHAKSHTNKTKQKYIFLEF